MAEVGKRMDFVQGFDFASPAEIFAEHAALSAFENDGVRDFDIGAYAEIDTAGYDALIPFQWPQPAGERPRKRFFADGRFYHPDGKARFVPVTPPAHRARNEAFPFTLNTGRVRDHWHTMTRTAKSARLSAHIAEPFCELHPLDALALGIADADLVRVTSPAGHTVIVRALLTERQAQGAVFVPMHWTGETAAAARVDALVPGRVDPVSGQPALKQAAAAVARYAPAAHGFLISSVRPANLPFHYWAIAKAEGGYRLELAGGAPAAGWEAWLRESLALPASVDVSGYADAASGDHRLLVFDGDRLLAALFVSRGPVAVSRQWAVEQLNVTHADTSARFLLTAGRPAPGQPDKGAIVCSCFSVGVNEIACTVRGGCWSVEKSAKA